MKDRILLSLAALIGFAVWTNTVVAEKVVSVVAYNNDTDNQQAFHIDSFQENASGHWQMTVPSYPDQPMMLLAERNDELVMIQRFFHQGLEYVEYGLGSREGDQLILNVTASRPLPGWSQQGVHSLTLSSDGLILEGSFKTKSGLTGPLKFERLGADGL